MADDAKDDERLAGTERSSSLDFAKPEIQAVEIGVFGELRMIQDLTPTAAAVEQARFAAQIQIAASNMDAAKAESAARIEEARQQTEVARIEAESRTAVANAERDKHVRSIRALVVGICVVAGLLAAVSLTVGILSGWEPWVMGAVTVPVAVVLLGTAPQVIAWLLKRLGG